MPNTEAVHRPLNLASPPVRGADVSALQSNVNRQFRKMNIDRSIRVDGVLGPQTFRAAKQCAICIGVTGLAHRKLKRHRISMGTQKLIRGRARTTREAIVGRARAGYRRRLRKRFAQAPGEKAVAKGRKLIGVTESPPGSNWGPMISKFIRFTGYDGPVFWCGCYACWVVVKLGGAKIPTRIRLGYAPYITADALAGRNGLTAVPAQDARPGDIACLWGGQHIEVVAERPSGGTFWAIGGNTSKGGQDNNGGGVYGNVRSLSDCDSGIVARPHWG